MNHGSRFGRRQAGFTIIELMMVVLIIAILAGLVLSISGIAGRKADYTKAAGDMEKIRNALEQYRAERGEYPDYTTPPLGNAYTTFMTSPTAGIGAYGPQYGITNAFKDPWGQEYQYKRDAQHKLMITLWSLGPDRSNGTPDDVGLSKGI